MDDQEPKYGLAVVGLVEPQMQVTNAGAKAGDVLVLTKPLGTGDYYDGGEAGGGQFASAGGSGGGYVHAERGGFEGDDDGGGELGDGRDGVRAGGASAGDDGGERDDGAG